MAGKPLFGKRRARAKHPADENRGSRCTTRGSLRSIPGKRRDQLIDVELVALTIVEHCARARNFAARPICRGIRFESLVVGAAGIERLAERKTPGWPCPR